MDLMKIDLDAKLEIDFFIVALELNPAIINLKGYVTLNREVLSSVSYKYFLYKYFFLSGLCNIFSQFQ